jgi:hypothetical protein
MRVQLRVVENVRSTFVYRVKHLYVQLNVLTVQLYDQLSVHERTINRL